MTARKTILIADDSALNREILREFFCQRYNILLAEDGEAAVSALQRHADEIALVLLDLVMPKKTGFEVLHFMREEHLDSAIPVIVITGSDDDRDELEAYNLGAADIIHKPFSPQIVERRVENIVELFARRAAVEQELERRTRELEAAYSYDRLTGLFSMRNFMTQVNDRLREAEREGRTGEYAIIYGNIRNFKFFNLNNGVEEGDRVLKLLAAKIKECCPPESLHSRFGNDHIVSFVPYVDCQTSIKRLNDYFGSELSTTNLKSKAGIYHIKEPGVLAAAACDFAKVACDTIRESSEAICFYNDQISHQIKTANYVVNHLDEAIESGYIQVYYQPVIRTITGAMCGMEALARWDDPVMGFLSPGDFIAALERNHLITKLDMHMLRLVCRDMRDAEQEGLKLIPVSFNLSRIDFLECDVFTEVEKVVREYSIPRDMINIEITESTIIEHPDYMRKIIGSFRQAGYQVWMDDFGSEYSSLNSLKDYQFDEIKLDMKFLSKFDDTCKTIIKSIVRMAKDLGVQTLAEGVETSEQLEFLREVGCEKAQGYLFSKPLPLWQLLPKMQEAGDQVEERAWRSYYNDIGVVNFITERSLSIVEFDGSDFSYLFVNGAYRKAWSDLGATSIDTVIQVTNSKTGILGRQLRDLQITLGKGDAPQEITAPVRGQYIRLSIVCVAEHESRWCYAVEITNLNSVEEEQQHDRMDSFFRDMYGLYDAIYVYDFATGSVKSLMYAPGNQSDDYKRFIKSDKPDFDLAGKAFIHPAERGEFKKFIDPSTAKQRLMASERGYLVHYFRSANSQGAYTWRIHTMLYVPNGDYVIYCVRAAFFNQEHLLERLAPDYLADAVAANTKKIRHLYRQSMMESKVVNVFWKDCQRRFTNVNEKFLSTYGFSDASMVLGKTDDDMGWHVEDGPFRDDEWDVLKHGKIVRNRLGRCIIQGVDHMILASKEPMYDNGEIVGLLGTFVVIDEVNGFEEIVKQDNVDQATQLMSASGLTDEVAFYIEGWRARQENFAVVRIDIPEYFRICRSYSERIAKGMLAEVGSLIAKTFGARGLCARLFGGNFSILLQCRDDKESVRQLCHEVMEKLSGIREFLGYPVTLNPTMELRFADEFEDARGITDFAVGGAALDIAEHKLLEEQFSIYELQLNTVIDAIPGGVVLYEMLPDGNHEAIYASAGVGRLSGRTESEFFQDSKGHRSNGMFEEDTEVVHRAIMDTVEKGTPLDVSYRVWHKNGSKIWVNLQGRVIGVQNGHPLLLGVFQNLSESASCYETALEDAQVAVFAEEYGTDDLLYQSDSATRYIELLAGGSYKNFKDLVAEALKSQGCEFQQGRLLGDYVVGLGDRTYRLHLSKQEWNGREARVVFLVDITANPQHDGLRADAACHGLQEGE